MADCCPHLQEPTDKAWMRLRNPLKWACDSCHSTDGIWCCLRCGHIGCGRRAHLPALGGGHSKHHFHTTQGNDEQTIIPCKDNSKRKRSKLLMVLRSKNNTTDAREVRNDGDISIISGGHEVCIDIVTKALHCYVCDDYILSDAPWLENLRNELSDIEFDRVSMDIFSTAPSTDDEGQENTNLMEADYDMIELPDDDDSLTAKSCDVTIYAENSHSFPAPLEPGITGLDNLGNTCYMNSVLQILSHCIGFRSFFRDFLRSAAPLRLAGEGGFTLTRQSTTRLKDAVHKDQCPDQLALTEATHALLRVLWSGRWRSISPRYFVNAVWKHSALFAARKQQDANEFLNFYLGRVDDELKPRTAKTSVMMDLFGINQYLEIRCGSCNTVSKRTEPLLGVVLSLPEKHPRQKSDEIQLLDCFESLQSSGEFVGDNQFHCDVCQKKTDAAWSVMLQRRPQSLLISLRRTLWDKVKGLHKDSRRVIFPLELDATNLLGPGNDKSPDDDFDGCHYSLKAVISHSGSSPVVGHYIAYVRVVNMWYLFNDSSVTPATESSVLDVEAFILLYERRPIPDINE